ncbi:MAG: hypothetical protein SU899_05165 [Chloroflexota bacterium]|nr:hypothetical protein [Chloroflexota bacterium]
MTVQIKKTYRGINPEMLCDEIRGLAQKKGLLAGETTEQTYSLPSGTTQSRITLVFKIQDKQTEEQKECGSVNIVSLPGGEANLLLELEETVLAEEKVSAFKEDLDFALDSYEVKW